MTLCKKIKKISQVSIESCKKQKTWSELQVCGWTWRSEVREGWSGCIKIWKTNSSSDNQWIRSSPGLKCSAGRFRIVNLTAFWPLPQCCKVTKVKPSQTGFLSITAWSFIHQTLCFVFQQQLRLVDYSLIQKLLPEAPIRLYWCET